MKAVKVLGSVVFLLAAFLVGIAAFSHQLLPADMDECQQNVSHLGHISDLPLFHCIGHTEFDMETGEWDHVHPWMDEEWMREHAPEHVIDPAQHGSG